MYVRAVTGKEPGAMETAITVRPYTTPTAAIILLLDRKDQEDLPSFCRSLPESRYSSTGVVCVSILGLSDAIEVT
jgi:hypothetical protein